MNRYVNIGRLRTGNASQIGSKDLSFDHKTSFFLTVSSLLREKCYVNRRKSTGNEFVPVGIQATKVRWDP